ncbi:hypothetical protein BB560_000451 [Smittium megazygosporum]|uniref:Uncharacterized protein n=1 Tax=Smittium megazygosporum TaxID=133381 RepID=A0A2T9ZKG4_9FUNG|nr:hypothetical protein BB560_000451 [Smittium megazygosporum]
MGSKTSKLATRKFVKPQKSELEKLKAAASEYNIQRNGQNEQNEENGRKLNVDEQDISKAEDRLKKELEEEHETYINKLNILVNPKISTFNPVKQRNLGLETAMNRKEEDDIPAIRSRNKISALQASMLMKKPELITMVTKAERQIKSMMNNNSNRTDINGIENKEKFIKLIKSNPQFIKFTKENNLDAEIFSQILTYTKNL